MALRDYTAKEVAEALREADGIITQAARILGCSRPTVYKAIDEYVTVRRAREEAQDATVDEAEGQLMKAMRNGEDWAIRMVLRTQRGEKWERKTKQQVEHSGGFQVNINGPDADDD